MKSFRRGFFVLPVVLGVFAAGWAQSNSGNKPNSGSNQAAQSGLDQEPDSPVAKPSEALKTDPVAARAAADEMLKTVSASTKAEERIAAMGALGTLEGYKKAAELVAAAFKDKDRDVRIAAIAAAGTLKDRGLIPELHGLLEDPTPEVTFAAAVTLWKLHDQGGIGILYGVLAGERKAGSSFMKNGMYEANKDMHSPSTLAKIGAEQGAYALMGPFGIGLDAARMMYKNNNGNSARVLTATLLAEDHTETTKRQLIDALQDKDAFVRSSAARGLGTFKGKNVTDALLDAFDDTKPSVRCTAAASYIRVTMPVKVTKHVVAAHS